MKAGRSLCRMDTLRKRASLAEILYPKMDAFLSCMRKLQIVSQGNMMNHFCFCQSCQVHKQLTVPKKTALPAFFFFFKDFLAKNAVGWTSMCNILLRLKGVTL